MVIDGSTAYILTMNFTRSAFTRNREFGIVDHGSQDTRAVDAIFNADWLSRPAVSRDQNLLLSPVNSRAGFLALLGRARRSVQVYAEEVQDKGIEAALIAAHRRGARVQLISNAGDATNVKGLARLHAGGVEVRLLSSPYIHAKAILVDNRWAFVGSENISPTSLDHNRELGVLISDLDALARLATTFAHDWSS
jgi:phosphatidylserine/phosphatidylglycerophosphate/cardiolipin synthase-like enzyme